MRTPRIIIPGASGGGPAAAGPEAYRHLIRVLRRRVGDAVIVHDGKGGSHEGTISRIDEAAEAVEILIGAEARSPAPLLPLAVAVGIPKGDAFELAIRMASETGLALLQPLLTARTLVRPRGGDAEKLKRWRRIAEESSKQCLRAFPLEIPPPAEWSAFLDGAGAQPSALRWIALPGGPDPGEAGLLAALEAASRGEPDGARMPWLAIGPEGGFSPEEVDLALERGLAPVGFPTPVLRTPTAIVYAAALAAWSEPLGGGSGGGGAAKRIY